jgi:hypothetical protein
LAHEASCLSLITFSHNYNAGITQCECSITHTFIQKKRTNAIAIAREQPTQLLQMACVALPAGLENHGLMPDHQQLELAYRERPAVPREVMSKN